MEDITQNLLEFINNPKNKDKIQKIKEEFFKKVPNESQERTEGSSATESSTQLPISNETLKTINKIMPLISSAKEDDSSTRFLSALRPLLNEKRKLKLDESLKVMQLIKLLPLLKSNGIIWGLLFFI